MQKIEKLVEEMSNLTIIESLELVKVLEKKWNINENQLSIKLDDKVTKKKENNIEKKYKIILVEIGGKKLSVIKEIKNITGKSLMGAKKMIDSIPSTIKDNLNLEESEIIKKKLEKLGAKINIK